MEKFIKYEAQEGVCGACVSLSRPSKPAAFGVSRRTFDLDATPHVKESLEREILVLSTIAWWNA
jgi:hypothetical protein